MVYSLAFVNEIQDFYKTLQELYARDIEQELTGGALEVYKNILAEAREMKLEVDLVEKILENIDLQGYSGGQYPRVADVMVVVKNLWSKLGTGRVL